MLKYAKAKGVRLEKEVANDLVESGLDPTARRMVLSGAAEGFKGDVKTALPLTIECKNSETWNPLEYYRQAERENRDGKTPIVVMSRNRERKYALLLWEDLIRFMKEGISR